MDWQRTAYIGAIMVVSLLLIYEWNDFQDSRKQLATTNNGSSVTIPAEVTTSNQTAETPDTTLSIPQAPAPGDNEIPSPTTETTVAVVPAESEKPATGQLVSVATDSLEIIIDLYGGDIIKSVLPKHKVELGGEQGFTLLDRTDTTTYISQSGLVGPNGTDTAEGRPLFSTAQSSYQLADGEDRLDVDLLLDQGGVKITKRFSFTRDQNLINVSYLVDNQSDKVWKANFYGQIKRDSHQPPAAADSGFGVNPYVGGATTTTDDQYKKVSFSDLNKRSENFSMEGGWIAMVQHYFTSAWAPVTEDTNQFFLRKLTNQDMYLFGFIGPQVSVNPGSQGELNSRFYVGPKDIDRLEDIADHLDLTIDYGWLWWIAKPLFHLLDFLHSYIGNWGWSIIALTIIIKAIFFYPSAVSYRSMAKMRKVSPKMQALKDRFGDDRQKMSQEMMKLYKTEKVNPMSGCLPILIQMPVFIALYWVLMESVELRHAPFILWIKDLSVMDPFFIFPLLMGATMFIQQKLNPTPPDPMQAKIMQWMPVAFTFLFLWFPAGMVVYWVTNNTLSIIQQYIITRNLDAI